MLQESGERVKVEYHLHHFSPRPYQEQLLLLLVTAPLVCSSFFCQFLIQCDKTSVICKLTEHKVFHYKTVIHHREAGGCKKH